MKDVPLRDALRATLRTQGLDYTIEDNYVRVARPDKLRLEPFEEVTTRIYQYNNAAATMPKIVVTNPGGSMNYGGYGGGYGYGFGYRPGIFNPFFGFGSGFPFMIVVIVLIIIALLFSSQGGGFNVFRTTGSNVC